MRGLIYPKIAAALFIVSTTGCAEGVDPGPIPEDSQTGRPTTTLSDNTNDIDTYKQIVTNRDDRNTEGAVEVYRDVAMFSYINSRGKQILSQWLLDETGEVYWNRYCRIDDKGGVLWNTCSSWDLGHAVADLGLPGVGSIAGMTAYVWNTHDSLGHPVQRLAQTVFTERGDQRLGRVCPIGKEAPVWEDCSSWERLAIETEQLQVPGALSLRDDFYYSYKNLDGEDVVVQNVLSIDGSLMWDRYCVSSQGSPFISSDNCGFGSRAPLRDYGIRIAAAAGGAQFTYMDAAKPMLSQTFISVDGTKSYNRTCTVTAKGVDWGDCSVFTASSLAQIRVTAGPL